MPTTLVHRRKWFGEKSTIGELLLGGEFLCFILEDPFRKGEKIYGNTAIPFGLYELALRYSDHFEMLLPLFLEVPNYKWIEFHPGNTPADTKGCPIPGLSRGEDWVGDSRKAFNKVMPIIDAGIHTGKVYWKIVDGRGMA